MLRSYLRLALFAVGLLVGVQVPGFINEYVQHVDAHRAEAQQGLKGFNDTAQQFFKGDLQALVAHYRISDDPVFRSDADSLGILISRQQLFDNEWKALQGPWYKRDWHVLTAAEPAVRQETFDSYRYQVLLGPDAIAWSVVCALLLAFVVEFGLLIIAWPFSGGRPRTAQRSWR